jgi:hypothetical protein
MLLHSSPDENLKQNWESGEGRFGSGLFFVNGYGKEDAYIMTAGESFIYALSDEIQSSLNVARKWDLDISEELQYRLDNFIDAEDSWDAQAELLALAINSGYDGVEDEDEQGHVVMLNGNIIIEKLEKI